MKTLLLLLTLTSLSGCAAMAAGLSAAGRGISQSSQNSYSTYQAPIYTPPETFRSDSLGGFNTNTGKHCMSDQMGGFTCQ